MHTLCASFKAIYLLFVKISLLISPSCIVHPRHFVSCNFSWPISWYSTMPPRRDKDRNNDRTENSGEWARWPVSISVGRSRRRRAVVNAARRTIKSQSRNKPCCSDRRTPHTHTQLRTRLVLTSQAETVYKQAPCWWGWIEYCSQWWNENETSCRRLPTCLRSSPSSSSASLVLGTRSPLKRPP